MTNADTQTYPEPYQVNQGSPAASDTPAVKAVTRSTCGKTIIVGEHAVVYGARAVAVPVPSMRITVKLTPLPQNNMASYNGAGSRGKSGLGRRHQQTPLIRLFLGGRSVGGHLTKVVYEACELLGIEPFAMDIEGQSSILIGAGLGSSASLCIVILKAVAASIGRTLTREELAQFGNQLEKRFHGNPSGLDTSVVAGETAISFKRNTPTRLVKVSSLKADDTLRPWSFALLDSGARSSTLSMIQIAAPYFQGRQGELRLATFDRLAGEVESGLETGNTALVASAMNEAALALDEAGVVSDRLHEIMSISRSAGALAQKPTGAGGGGCVLVLLDPFRSHEQVAILKNKLGTNQVIPVELLP